MEFVQQQQNKSEHHGNVRKSEKQNYGLLVSLFNFTFLFLVSVATEWMANSVYCYLFIFQ